MYEYVRNVTNFMLFKLWNASYEISFYLSPIDQGNQKKIGFNFHMTSCECTCCPQYYMSIFWRVENIYLPNSKWLWAGYTYTYNICRVMYLPLYILLLYIALHYFM